MKNKCELTYNLSSVLDNLTEERSADKELAILILLDDNLNYKSKINITKRSTESYCTYDMDNLFNLVKQNNIKNFIYSHNHPGGPDYPSNLDKKMTYQLYKQSLINNVNLIDHLITCDKYYYFFQGRGFLTRKPNDYIF